VAGNTALAARTAPATERITRPELSVVPAAEAPSPRMPFVVLVLALIAAGLIALLLLNTAINENAFRLHSLETNKKALDLRQQQLEQDILELENPGPLNAAAQRQGLVPIGQPAFIELPDGKIIGVPTPARALPSPRANPQPSARQSPAAKTGSSTPDSAAPGNAPPPGVGGSVKPGPALTGTGQPGTGKTTGTGKATGTVQTTPAQGGPPGGGR
jgi:hypothetical protein